MSPNNTVQQPGNRPYPPRHSSFEHGREAARYNRQEQDSHTAGASEQEQRSSFYNSHGVVASHFLAQPQNAQGGETWIDFLTNPTAEPQPSTQHSSSSRYALPNRPPPRTDSSSSRSSDRKRRLTTTNSPHRRPSSIRMHSDHAPPSNPDQAIPSASIPPTQRPLPALPSARPQPPLPPPPDMRSLRRESDLVLPPWQPDADVTQCPVCSRTFTFLYRKHHCRKCGRVVCANCSPHRITIPRQFIVHPPSDISHIIDLTGDDENAFPFFHDFGNPALGGGAEVRVCNPCVPDPNYSPPPGYATGSYAQNPPRLGPSQTLPRTHRSTSSIHDATRTISHRPAPRQREPSRESRDSSRRVSYHGSTTSGERWLPPLPTGEQSQAPYLSSSASRYTTPNSGHIPFNMGPGSQSIINMFPRSQFNTVPTPSQPAPRPRRQIAEEDECPICGNELPPKGPDDDETARTTHIEECIALHSHSASPAPVPLTQQTSASLPNQRTRGMSNAADGTVPSGSNPNRLSHAARGMFPFVATEKDCVDAEGNEEECIICFEEYEAGDKMARLVCWCKFHEQCIRDWWDKKGRGACPTHQLHD